MTFFSKNLHYIKKNSEVFYHVFSKKTNPGGASIHRKKELFPLKPPLVKSLERNSIVSVAPEVSDNQEKFGSLHRKQMQF